MGTIITSVVTLQVYTISKYRLSYLEIARRRMLLPSLLVFGSLLVIVWIGFGLLFIEPTGSLVGVSGSTAATLAAGSSLL